jgi:serine/threonine protein phosphatase 1
MVAGTRRLPALAHPIVRFAKNPSGRDFAVGDVHGAFTGLQAALDSIGFDSQSDRLFSVGDLVDRGPQSERVLDWLDRPWFHAVCGNHDFMAWRSALGWPLRSIDHASHGGAWLADLPREERIRIGTRLAQLPVAIEVQTSGGPVGLVHADLPSDDWLDLAKIDWQALDKLDSEAAQCLWSVDRYAARDRAGVKNIRAVVHGHKTIPQAEALGNVHFIDTGGWHPGGRFTFIELETLTATAGPGPQLARPVADEDI